MIALLSDASIEKWLYEVLVLLSDCALLSVSSVDCWLHWACGGFAPCGPSALLAKQKGLIRNKDMSFGNPPYHGMKIADFQKISIFIFQFLWVKKWYFGSKNGVLSVLDRV